MRRSKKSLYNLIFGVGNQLVVLCVGLIVPKFFIMSYGSEINGLQSSIAYIYTYIALLEAGIGTATLQALFGTLGRENKEETNAILSATNIQYKKIAMMYAVCMLIFAFVYPNTITTSINKVTISLMVLLSGVSSLLSFLFCGKFVVLLQADGRSYIVSFIGLVNYLLMNTIKIVFIIKGYSIISIYIGAALVSFAVVIFYYFYRRKYYNWVSYQEKPKMEAIAQSKNVLVHQIANIVCNSTDVLVLTYVARDLKLVSIYNLYIMVFDAVKSIIANIFSSVQFIMGQTYNKDIELYRKYHQIYEVCDFAVSFSLYSTAYVLVLPFMKIYTKGIQDINYIDPYLPLLFVTVKLLTSAREPAALVINYAGHFKKTQNRAVIETIINVIVSIVGVYFCGIYGVLIGTIVALLYRTIDMYLYSSRRFLKRSPWQSIKQWGVYLLGFLIVAHIFSIIKIEPRGYIEFFGIAILVCVGISMFYIVYTFIFNYRIVWPVTKQVVRKLKEKRGV
ncbi:hypothetical protein HMPREF0490_01098 [Lachnospiraceae bacterium 6_1_37FAA]|nr:hypothetical protein HMPREF0490_01098 [Lachnospiraceae bacterium 6_1_37FAA]